MSSDAIPANIQTAISVALLKQDSRRNLAKAVWVVVSLILSAIVVTAIYLSLSAAAKGATYLDKIKNFSLVQAHGTIMGGLALSIGIFFLMGFLLVAPEEEKLKDLAHFSSTYKKLKETEGFDEAAFLSTLKADPQKLVAQTKLMMDYEKLQAATSTVQFIEALGKNPQSQLKKLEKYNVLKLSETEKKQLFAMLKNYKKLCNAIERENATIRLWSRYGTYATSQQDRAVYAAKAEIATGIRDAHNAALSQFYTENLEFVTQIKSHLNFPQSCTESTSTDYNQLA